MRVKRYNKGVSWAKSLDILVANTLNNDYNIVPTLHCRDRINQYGLRSGCYMTALRGDVVEIEVIDDVIVKIITRFKDNVTNKIMCFATVIEDKRAVVKSVWVNDGLDNHYTINKQNYNRIRGEW